MLVPMIYRARGVLSGLSLENYRLAWDLESQGATAFLPPTRAAAETGCRRGDWPATVTGRRFSEHMHGSSLTRTLEVSHADVT